MDQSQGQMQAQAAANAHAQMQVQLTSANAQILALAQMLEAVRADQERLRRESEAAYTDLQRNVGQGPRREQRLSFVNQKHYEGGKFLGNKNENFKVWGPREFAFIATRRFQACAVPWS